MKDHIESIFKVMPYYFARSWRKLHYPEFKTKVVAIRRVLARKAILKVTICSLSLRPCT